MKTNRAGMRVIADGALLLLALACLPAIGCAHGQAHPGFSISEGGNAQIGKQLIVSKGCGACHVIPGIPGARGLVGPPLFFYGRRTIIAGELPNTPDNLVRWIKDPKQVEPGTAMPDLNVNDQQARDIAAYLYTLQ
ncbi:MAG: c-type cytochrome [Acidobacteriaceae bacterium]